MDLEKFTLATRWAAVCSFATVVGAGLFATGLYPTACVAAAGPQAARIYIDPDTGERRAPDAAERRQLRRTAPATSVPMKITHREGMKFAQVPRERRTRLHADVDAQGQVKTYHGEARDDE